MRRCGDTKDRGHVRQALSARSRDLRAVLSLDLIVLSVFAHDRRSRIGMLLFGITAFVVSVAAAPGVRGLLGGILALLTLAILLTDLRFFIIPDGLNVSALALGLAHAALRSPDLAVSAAAWALLRGAGLAAAFLALHAGYRWWRGREGMGLGDVKLAAAAGAWLNWWTIPVAIEIAALAALGVYGFRQIVLRRPLDATAKLPFGVFFAPAIWLGWLIEAVL